MQSRKAYYGRLTGELLGLIGVALLLSLALMWIAGESWLPVRTYDLMALREQLAIPQATALPVPLSTAAADNSDTGQTGFPPTNTPHARTVLLPSTPAEPAAIRRSATKPMPSPALAEPSIQPLPSSTPTAFMPSPATHTSEVSPRPEENDPLEQSGDQTITGLVLTDMGNPVPDLDVTATVNRLFETAIPGPHTPQVYRTRTNQHGAFEIQDLLDGEYTLETRPVPPYSSTTKRVRAGIEEVTLVVAEVGSQKVEGLVTQAGSNTPLQGVTISAASQSTTTDESGRYALAVALAGPGQNPTLLRFTHPAYREQQLTVPNQPRPTDQALTLKDVALKAVQGRAPVTGVVEHQLTGKPLAGLRVFLSPAKGPGQQDTLTGHDGTFRFAEVPWGTYTLVVAPKTGFQDLTYPNLQVTQTGVEHLPLRLTPIPSSVVTGHFVDSAGQPVRGLTLFLTSRTVRTFTGIPVTSDPSGYFVIQDVPAGELEFGTRSDPYLSITGLTVQAGDTAPRAVPVDWGLQILTGRVVSAGGLPVPGAEVTLSWSQTTNGLTSRSIRHGLADATGTFRFTQLGPGTHKLNVIAPGYTRTLLDHPIGPDHPTVQVTLAARVS